MNNVCYSFSTHTQKKNNYPFKILKMTSTPPPLIFPGYMIMQIVTEVYLLDTILQSALRLKNRTRCKYPFASKLCLHKG